MRKQLPTTSIIHGIFTVSLLFIGSFLTINHVNAQSSENLYGLTPTANKVLGDKATDEKNISSTVGRSIQIALSFVGVLFMVLFVYAGFRWMTAQGNTDNVTVPKNMMIAATLGLLYRACRLRSRYLLLTLQAKQQRTNDFCEIAICGFTLRCSTRYKSTAYSAPRFQLHISSIFTKINQ